MASAGTDRESTPADGVVAKVRQAQIVQQKAAIGMRIGAHAAIASGRKFGQLRAQLPA